MNELKPCPFCGNKLDLSNVSESKYGGWFVTCGYCGANTGDPDRKEFAISEWNDRNDGWIPCSKHLPQESNIYLVTKRNGGNIETLVCYYEICSGEEYGEWMCESGNEQSGIIAWQPLPEPYQP